MHVFLNPEFGFAGNGSQTSNCLGMYFPYEPCGMAPTHYIPTKNSPHKTIPHTYNKTSVVWNL